MAVHLSCDGCGKVIEGAGHKAGCALVRDYCNGCWPKVQEYMAYLLRIRQEASAQYLERKNVVMLGMQQDVPGIKLPDVP